MQSPEHLKKLLAEIKTEESSSARRHLMQVIAAGAKIDQSPESIQTAMAAVRGDNATEVRQVALEIISRIQNSAKNLIARIASSPMLTRVRTRNNFWPGGGKQN
jgi:hypothetical protein